MLTMLGWGGVASWFSVGLFYFLFFFFKEKKGEMLLIHEFSAGACWGQGVPLLLAAPCGEMHLQSQSWSSPAPPRLGSPFMGSGDLS